MATVIAAFTGSERHKCALDDIEGEIDRGSQCLQAPHPVIARMTGRLSGTSTSVGSADSSGGTFGDGLASPRSTACTARRASARQRVLVEECRPVASRSSTAVVASDDVVVINTAAARLLEPDDHALLRAHATQALVGQERVLEEVRLSAGRADRHAGHRQRLLITGEARVGKLAVARAVHDCAATGENGSVFDAASCGIEESRKWLGGIPVRLRDSAGTVIIRPADLLEIRALRDLLRPRLGSAIVARRSGDIRVR